MYHIIPVLNRFHRREFLEFAPRLHQNDPNYIRPLDKDIEERFDKEKNKLFLKGTAERFLCIDNHQKTVGKFAVFINPNYLQEQPTGGIGFFDCIEDQKAANVIFDFAKNWLQEKGMHAMDGSINFGERNQFWGVLVEGFSEPLYGMNYNYPYYKTLFENYGFEVFYNQLCYSRPIHGDVSRKFILSHRRHEKNPAITAKRLVIKDLEKFATDFSSIYNAAWANHGGGKQITLENAIKNFRKMKPIINEHISWFVYENQEPIAMWINLPDLNQWYKKMKGKWGILQKIKLLWLKKKGKNTKMTGIVFGVIPKWQKSGIEGYMIWEGTKHIRENTNFKSIELQWIGDFNPKMIKIAENLDTEITTKLSTYRYLFDRQKSFKRHPEI